MPPLPVRASFLQPLDLRIVARLSVSTACCLLLATLALQASIGLTYLAGGRLTALHFLVFPIVLATLMAMAPGLRRSLNRDARIGLGIGVALFLVASFLIAGTTYDLSPDGQTNHLRGITHLAHGWNPVHDPVFDDRPEDYVLEPSGAGQQVVDAYLARRAAKGMYMAAAAAQRSLGLVEVGKAFNLILIGAAAATVLAAGIAAGLTGPVAAAVALVAALNPIAVGQSLTHYLDGPTASLLTCVLALSVILPHREGRLPLLGWGAALALLMASKVNGLGFAGILGPSAVLYVRWKTGRFTGVGTFLAASLIGGGIIGFHPYVSNFLSFGDAFYAYQDVVPTAAKALGLGSAALAAMALTLALLPAGQRPRLIGAVGVIVALVLGAAMLTPLIADLVRHGPSLAPEDADGNVGMPWPPWHERTQEVRPEGRLAPFLWELRIGSEVLRNRAEGLLVSLLAESAVNPPRVRLKTPFRIAGREIRAFRLLNPDLRAGGLGPWMGGAAMLALVVLVMSFASRVDGRYETCYFVLLILTTAMMIPEPWWARFVPHLWLGPLAIAALGCQAAAPTRVRRTALALLFVMSVNAGLVVWATARGQMILQPVLGQTYDALEHAPQPLPVYYSNFLTTRDRLKRRGIETSEVAVEDCPSYLALLRSEVRVCVRDPSDPTWQALVAEGRRLEQRLARSGLASYRIVLIEEASGR